MTNLHLFDEGSEWAKNPLSPTRCGHMSDSAATGFELPPVGRVLSILSEDPRAPLHWLAMVQHELGARVSVFSRLSPQRLGQHLRLDRIEFKWLSESIDSHSLPPSLERIHHAISTRIATDGGIIWLDGVEFLIHRQGFDAFLAFTRSLADELTGTDWSLMLPFSPLSLEGTAVAQLRREASPFEIQVAPRPAVSAESDVPAPAPAPLSGAEETEIEVEVEAEVSLPEVGGLTMLTSIASAALSPAVLMRRRAQWQEMGFDVTELDHALTLDDEGRYAIYRAVENRVRRAIECERRLRMIEMRGHMVEAVKMRFRILQLTGLTAIENRLDELLAGEA